MPCGSMFFAYKLHYVDYCFSFDPRLISDLPFSDSWGTIEYVTGIAIRNEILYLEGDGYSTTAPHCCPDLFIKNSYQWNGSVFVIVHSQVTKR